MINDTQPRRLNALWISTGPSIKRRAHRRIDFHCNNAIEAPVSIEELYTVGVLEATAACSYCFRCNAIEDVLKLAQDQDSNPRVVASSTRRL
jgi:hypothetical protein